MGLFIHQGLNLGPFVASNSNRTTQRRKMAVPIPTDTATPASAHVADPALRPFLQPAFSPTDYLNATLPSLSVSSVSSRPLKQGTSAPLADLSSQTQDLLSQLNAHTTRLSAILTQLTDDILRSGARLAYEVEVLRGETFGLTDTLGEGLKGDMERFLAGGIPTSLAGTTDPAPQRPASQTAQDDAPGNQDAGRTPGSGENDQDTTTTQHTPLYITHLQTLTLVRSRLDHVIRVFGDAMHWTLPPSELSLTSSLISVSAPEADSDTATRERKGKDFAEKLRAEISDLVTGDEAGSEAAMVRIQALRDLAEVWKGTGEEKARAKFVDGLVRLVEERQRAVESAAGQRRRGGRSGGVSKPPPAQKSGGLLDNLQRIRENIYLE